MAKAEPLIERVNGGTTVTEYRVRWEIDLSADSPREAAEMALAIHRDPNSIATVFLVYADTTRGPVVVDLDEPADPDRTSE